MNVFFLRNINEARAQRISITQGKRVVIEEEHSNDIDTVAIGLQLGENHIPEDVINIWPAELKTYATSIAR